PLRRGARPMMAALETRRRTAAASRCCVKPKTTILMSMPQPKRRYPIGAELISENETHFRVWAPKASQVDLVLEDVVEGEPEFCALTPEPGGYFSGTGNVSAGARYRFRMNAGENFYPDPASRFQPDGPHGASCIVDPTKFQWSDAEWPGLILKGQII